MVDGLWQGPNAITQNFQAIVWRIKLLGFNTVRLPFSFQVRLMSEQACQLILHVLDQCSEHQGKGNCQSFHAVLLCIDNSGAAKRASESTPCCRPESLDGCRCSTTWFRGPTQQPAPPPAPARSSRAWSPQASPCLPMQTSCPWCAPLTQHATLLRPPLAPSSADGHVPELGTTPCLPSLSCHLDVCRRYCIWLTVSQPALSDHATNSETDLCVILLVQLHNCPRRPWCSRGQGQ